MQHLRPAEVIVVDNASSDGAPRTVRERFPDVQLIELDSNQGATARNVGFAAASGSLVLSLDDDIALTDPRTLSLLNSAFSEDPELGAVTLKICEPPNHDQFVEHHWVHSPPRSRFQNRRFATDHINEGAVAFRATALRQVGGYDQAAFWGGEEWELCLALLHAGWGIRYEPIPVLHLSPRGDLRHRPDPRHRLLIRNRVLTALRRLPAWECARYLAGRLPIWCFRAHRHGYGRQFWRAMADIVSALPAALRQRQPVSVAALNRARALGEESSRHVAGHD